MENSSQTPYDDSLEESQFFNTHTRPVEKKILIFNLDTQSCANVTYEAVTELSSKHRSRSNLAIVLQNIEEHEAREIRSFFSLHPILDTECGNSVLNVKDSFLAFDDYFLLTLSDADTEHNVENAYSVKMVLLKHLILVFTNGVAHCVDDVFSHYLQFTYSQRAQSGIPQPTELYNEHSLVRSEIGLKQGCTLVESAFHQVIESIVAHLEVLVLKMGEEVNFCWSYCNALDFRERGELVSRMSYAGRKMAYLTDLVTRKESILMALSRSQHVSEHLECYIVAMRWRTATLVKRLKRSYNLLSTTEKMFNTCMEDNLTVISSKMNDAMKRFSAIATIFLPLNLVAALWGMNVNVPGQEGDGLYSFGVVVSCVLVSLVTIMVYFRRVKWF